jgi:hypothetical protein
MEQSAFSRDAHAVIAWPIEAYIVTFSSASEVMVMKNDPKDETYTEAETVARREAALKYALTTPPKPHHAMRKGRKESSQSK